MMVNKHAPDFSWEILDKIPPDKNIVQFPRNPAGYSKGYLVRVIPKNGSEWIGNFQGIDNHYFYGVIPWILDDFLCVVSGGIAYIVNFYNPESYEKLSVVPITNAINVFEFETVIFATFTYIIAFRKNGIAWKTDNLAMDGIEITEIKDGKVYGRSNQIIKYVPFAIDLQTGETKLEKI